MNGANQEQAQRRDRWVDVVVTGLFVVALALGWGVKASAEARTASFAGNGIVAQYPAGWVQAETKQPVVFQVEDRLATPFRTTISVQRRPLPPKDDAALATVQSTMVLERGPQLAAFRVLSTREGVTIGGRSGMEVTFAYVESNPNPFLETLPVVVVGKDFLFAVGDQAYVVTLTATEASFDHLSSTLDRFVRTLQVKE
jgi:hypothetical protein